MQLINPAFGFAPSTVKWRTMPMNSSSFRVWPIWTSLLVGEIIVIFRTCTLDTSGSEHLWTNAQNASVCMENSETNRIKKNCHVSGKQFRCDFPYFRRCSMYKISMSCGYLWQMIAKTQLPCALLDFWWYLMMAWRSTMSFDRSNSSIMHRGMAPPHGLQLSIFLSMRKVSTPSWIAGAIAWWPSPEVLWKLLFHQFSWLTKNKHHITIQNRYMCDSSCIMVLRCIESDQIQSR